MSRRALSDDRGGYAGLLNRRLYPGLDDGDNRTRL